LLIAIPDESQLGQNPPTQIRKPHDKKSNTVDLSSVVRVSLK